VIKLFENFEIKLYFGTMDWKQEHECVAYKYNIKDSFKEITCESLNPFITCKYL